MAHVLKVRTMIKIYIFKSPHIRQNIKAILEASLQKLFVNFKKGVHVQYHVYYMQYYIAHIYAGLTYEYEC